MKYTNIISKISSVLVAALAVIAFVISYDALRSIAVDTGAIPSRLAWLWPLVVDGALVVFSLAVLRNHLMGEGTRLEMVLVGAFALFGVLLNVLHAPDDPVAWFIAGTAPVGLFLSFEVLMRQVRSEIRRNDTAVTLEQLTEKVVQAQGELDKLTRQIETLIEKRDAVKVQISELQKEKRVTRRELSSANDPGNGSFVPSDREALDRANDTRQAQIDARREHILDLLRDDPKATYSTLAEAVGVSAATVKRDLAHLTDAGRVIRNGQGLEVVDLDQMPAVQVETAEVN